MSSILVTGASGFLGLHLTTRLADRGHHVRAVVQPGQDVRELEAIGVEVVRADVRDLGAIQDAASACDVVYHLAARTADVEGRASDFAADNVAGTACTAQAAVRAGARRLVFASSAAVYGIPRHRPIDEETQTRPDTVYGRSKLAAEGAVLERHRRDGLPVVIARLSPVFGPRATSWLGLFRAIASKRFRLMGPGDTLQQTANVADIVEGLTLSAEHGSAGRIYLLAGPEALPLRRMLELIATEMGVELRRGLPASPLRLYKLLGQLVPGLDGSRLPRYDRVRFFLSEREYDISRARAELGYSPQVDTAQGIRETAEWYRERGLLRLRPGL